MRWVGMEEKEAVNTDILKAATARKVDAWRNIVNAFKQVFLVTNNIVNALIVEIIKDLMREELS